MTFHKAILNTLSLSTPEDGLKDSIASPSETSQKDDYLPSAITGMAGLCGFAFGLLLLQYFHLEGQQAGLLLAGMTGMPMLAHELYLLFNTKICPTNPLFSTKPSYNVKRSLEKCLGVIISVGFVALLYWLFPEYHGNFYEPFYSVLKPVAVIWLLMLFPYVLWVDARMKTPEDGYWQLGRICLLHFENIRKKTLLQHLGLWVVKGFFLPLMWVYLCNNTRFLRLPEDFSTFKQVYDYLSNLIFSIDLCFAAVGYSMTLRIFNAHVRSVEPTTLGWLSALACYQPFWSLIGNQFIAYHRTVTWEIWFQNMPAAYITWGVFILLSNIVFVWATICFGIRFSNLTHRGIINFGPYYFTKHPAYIAKIFSYILIFMPVISRQGIADAIRNMALMVLISLVYYIRARTEEEHLSAVNETYRLYSEQIRKRHAKWLSILAGKPQVPRI